MPRSEPTYEDLGVAGWLRSVLLPFLVFLVVAAIVCGLVLSGAVQGHRAYAPAAAPTTQPTVLIEP